MANILDLIGRILISALFLISAFNKIFNLEGSMSWMEGFGMPGFLIFPAIAVEVILPIFVIFILDDFDILFMILDLDLFAENKI